MRTFLILISSLLLTQLVFSQDLNIAERTSNQGRLYIYWGWNWGWYTRSNIHFSGEGYDFTLDKVVAKDRQSHFGVDPYFNPGRITIPQYNYRIGYYFNENWDISLGMDHMKYVVQQEQTVTISGSIDGTGTPYDGTYNGDDILITEGFLQFEHTDGLNYLNSEIRHTHHLFEKGVMRVNLKEGAGLGVVIPKTNTTLLNKDRYDEFHLAGYGLDILAGLNFTFYNIFFVQSEVKGGFIHLPDIRTTNSTSDNASQHFFFSQVNIVFGGIIHL